MGVDFDRRFWLQFYMRHDENTNEAQVEEIRTKVAKQSGLPTRDGLKHWRQTNNNKEVELSWLD